MHSIFSGLITSKMRIRILMRLFLNPGQQAYLRELADEFDASPSQVREELQHLSAAGLLSAQRNGRQTHYRADISHPLFPELHSMVKKALGMDHVLDSIVERLGRLDLALLVGDYAAGRDTGVIDLILVGKVDPGNLNDLVAKTERYVKRKIRTLIVDTGELERLGPYFRSRSWLLLWKRPGCAIDPKRLLAADRPEPPLA
ncbi:MAG: winged helix-turn-helix transcriptional regulator [Gammaproteobacteria bacterium]|nr:winged helix-turn-helix transcriptional regulator [Gammaproteobacteria bacterium]